MRRFAALLLALHVAATVGGAAFGIYFLTRRELGTEALLAAAAVALLSLSLLVLGVVAYCQFVLLHKAEGNTYRLYDAILDSNDQLRRQTDLIHTIAENASLSDWVKKIVHREKDHEYLRDTIHGSIVRQDWEAAGHLIQSLDEELGYAEEARQLRQELARAQQATIEEKVERAMKRFDELCAARKWAQAARETARLQKLFPGNDRIAALPAELELRRQQHKRQLLKEYDQAARNNDVSRAHQLLIELDQYLAANEAAALKDSARGVFKAKLMQMGVQFSLAVSEKQYASAIDIGERIMREFPNSRYAAEITEMLPHLRRRLQGEPELAAR